MILYVHAPADDTSTPPGRQPSHHVLRLMAIFELTFELRFYIPRRGVATAGDASPVRPTMSPLHQLVDICVPRRPIMAPSAQSAAVSRPTGHWTVDNCSSSSVYITAYN